LAAIETATKLWGKKKLQIRGWTEQSGIRVQTEGPSHQRARAQKKNKKIRLPFSEIGVEGDFRTYI